MEKPPTVVMQSLFFEERRWKYAFIGGLANLRWGQPRTTEDIDTTLLWSDWKSY
jgi:hypothetical protein